MRVSDDSAGDVGVAPDGSIAIAWQHPRQGGFSIGLRRYDAKSAPIGNESWISAPTDTSFSPVVAMAGDGTFVVAWSGRSVRSSVATISARRFAADGSPLGSPLQINTTPPGLPAFVAVAADAEGNFVVTWRDEGSASILGQCVWASGKPKGGEFRVSGTEKVSSADVAMDTAGNFVVAWATQSRNNEGLDILARRYDRTGEPAGGAFPVKRLGVGFWESPAIAMQRDGGFLITWHSHAEGTTKSGTWAREFGRDATPRGDEQSIGTVESGIAESSVPVAMPDGSYAVVGISWPSGTEDENVYMRRLGADGSVLGPAVRVNTHTPGQQRNCHISTNTAGDVVITWDGAEAGTLHGVRAQRYQTTSHPATIRGYVWSDDNNDGLQNEREHGRQGVVVRAMNAHGALIAQTATDEQGNYRFAGLLPKEPLYVEFTPPAGAVFTEPRAAANDGRRSLASPASGRTSVYSLAEDEQRVKINAGLVQESSIAGLVFEDRNGNGRLDEGEEGLEAWVIYVDANGNGSLDPGERTTTTDSAGGYALHGLTSGAYALGLAEQDGWVSAGPRTVTIATGQSAAVHFGNRTTLPNMLALPKGGATRLEDKFRLTQGATSALAANGRGDFMVVWKSFAGRAGLYGRRCHWEALLQEPEAQIPSVARPEYISDEPCNPSVMTTPEGGFLVAWDLGDKGSGLYARRMGASGVPEPKPLIMTTAPAGNSSLATDGKGTVIATWQTDQRDGDGWEIRAQRYNSLGSELTPPFRVNTYTRLDQTMPRVAASPDGSFVIVWQSSFQDGNDFGIYSQRYDASARPAGSEFRVNEHTFSRQDSPLVGMSADGSFVIAWVSANQDGSGLGVYAKRYNQRGVAQGGEFRVNEYTQGDQTSPALAMAPSGHFVIAWISATQDEGAPGVYARLYNAAGVPQGHAFLVSTKSTGAPLHPSVAMDDDGRIIIVWETQDRGGYSRGLWARQYQAERTQKRDATTQPVPATTSPATQR